MIESDTYSLSMFMNPPYSAVFDYIVLHEINLTDVAESVDKLLLMIETAPPLLVAELP